MLTLELFCVVLFLSCVSACDLFSFDRRLIYTRALAIYIYIIYVDIYIYIYTYTHTHICRTVTAPDPKTTCLPAMCSLMCDLFLFLQTVYIYHEH